MELLSSFLLTTGMVITIIIVFALLRANKRELPQYILIVLFICLFFVSFNGYGQLHGISLIYAIGFLFSDPIGFLIGPLLYIYIKSLYQPNNNLIRNHLRHFIPYVIYVMGITIPFFISHWTGESLFSYQKTIEQNEFILHFQAIYLLGYCLLSLNLLSKYQNTLKHNYSNLQAKDLSWIRYLLIGLVLIILIHLSTVLFELFVEVPNWDTAYITTFFMIGVILYLGYYGSSQSRILLPAHLIEESVKPQIEHKQSPPSHHLVNASEEEIEQLIKRLKEVLHTEKPYLDEDLTLGALAQLIPTTDKKLSALLNHTLDISFYDLINSYRVEEVKTKMADKSFDHYTLLAIAFESGFKSKTSFNRIFKKATGLSPSAYKKSF